MQFYENEKSAPCAVCRSRAANAKDRQETNKKKLLLQK